MIYNYHPALAGFLYLNFRVTINTNNRICITRTEYLMSVRNVDVVCGEVWNER